MPPYSQPADCSEDTTQLACGGGVRAGGRYLSPLVFRMAFLDSKRDRAAFLIFVLGLGWALWPFSTGLIGAPVLYVVFAPAQRWLARRMNPRLAAALVILIGIS